MFDGLTLAQALTLHTLATVLALLLYIVTSHLMQHRRHPSAAIAWVLFILLLPYLALPIFWTFGSRKQVRPRAGAALTLAATDAAAAEPWAVRTARALGQPGPSAYAGLHVHADGRAALDALWQVIDGAQTSLDVCTYILGHDALGDAVVERLAAQARSGVRVRVLLDGLGRLIGGRPKLAPLRAAGVALTLFVPPLHSPLKGRTNLRNHRKLVIADAGQPTERVWSGGRNLASEYFEGEPGRAAWHDFSFDLRGPLVRQAQHLFEHDWAFARGDKAARRASAEAFAAGSTPFISSTSTALVPSGSAQLVASGPDQVDDTLHALFVGAAYRASHRLQIATPYFVPDAALLMALCLAARRGVQVDVLLPARSNHRLSDLARQRALRAVAAAGARIHLTPHMLHAKLVIVDAEVAFAGSANLDGRSLFLNYELMFAFLDPAAVGACREWYGNELRLAVPNQPKRAGLLTDVAEGLVLWLGFQL